MKTREEIVLLVDSELSPAFARISEQAPEAARAMILGAAFANIADRIAGLEGGNGFEVLESIISSMGDLLARVRDRQAEPPAHLN